MNKARKWSVFILLCLVLYGCGSSDSKETDADTIFSFSPTPTPAPTATLIPIPTSVATPTSISTPTSTSTPTPLSTVKKTGQSTSYNPFDDGYYGLGVTPSYSKEGDMVMDNITGLKWLEITSQADSSFTWEDAMSHCDRLSSQGHFDWRLPTINELLGLVDRGNESQAFDPIFSHLLASVFWSSTIVKEQDSLRWGIHIVNVGGYRYEKTYKHAVMCVRR